MHLTPTHYPPSTHVLPLLPPPPTHTHARTPPLGSRLLPAPPRGSTLEYQEYKARTHLLLTLPQIKACTPHQQ